MNPHLEQFTDDYFSSSHFSALPSVLKPSAEEILAHFCAFQEREEGQTMSVELLERFLTTIVAATTLDAETKRSAPYLLESFFTFLQTSGHYPAAGNWSIDLALAGATFLSRLRDDGSLRGDTFQKKYSDVGRNDPCPCGSGKKFKKCCMKLIDGSV